MTPEQHVFVITLVFFAIVLALAVIAIALRIGRYLGSRDDQACEFQRGYAAGRRDERYDAARDPLMPRTWPRDEATYPAILETLADGSHHVCTPRRPQG